VTVTSKRFPHRFNYAWPITAQNAESQYRLARRLPNWLKVEVIWMFLFLEWMTIWVALGRATGLSIVFLPIVLIMILSTIGIYFYQAYRAR
jgi:hypothetical protein